MCSIVFSWKRLSQSELVMCENIFLALSMNIHCSHYIAMKIKNILKNKLIEPFFLFCMTKMKSILNRIEYNVCHYDRAFNKMFGKFYHITQIDVDIFIYIRKRNLSAQQHRFYNENDDASPPLN